jgi:cytochrome c oxidase subunit 2
VLIAGNAHRTSETGHIGGIAGNVPTGDTTMMTVKRAVFFAVMFFLWSMPAGRAASPRRIEITARRFTYDPNVITLKRGEPVILVFHSTDVTHGLKVAELNIITEDIKKGKDSEIQFTPQEAGQYIGQCAHFCGKGHGSMKLQINVVP